MYAVFQDIVRMARVELDKALMCDVSSWDSDAFEQEVREFTRQLGLESIHVWAELKGVQAAEQAAICACGQRRQVHKRKQTWWLTTFGRVATVEPYLSCPGCLSHDRPFQRLTGLKCRGKSMSLQRVLTDFGAEKSFGGASQQLWEHYRVKLDRSSVREVVREQAQRAEEFVGAECQKAVSDYQRRKEAWPGEQWLIVESDGSMVRTGELEACPQGEESPKPHPESAEGRRRPKRRRKTQWREVRLSTAERLGEGDRLYGAIMGPPTEVGEQLFALAVLMGWGEETLVHGVGDGAPWIAQQMAEVFPRHRYLLDRYHLLEHLYAGSVGLPEGAVASAREWVERQLVAIDAAQVDKVVKECRCMAGQDPDHPLEDLARYLANQKGHLDYVWATQHGLPIGSGAVEGGHRHVIQARLKLPGAWWSQQSVNPLLALRTLRANGWWEAFWN